MVVNTRRKRYEDDREFRTQRQKKRASQNVNGSIVESVGESSLVADSAPVRCAETSEVRLEPLKASQTEKPMKAEPGQTRKENMVVSNLPVKLKIEIRGRNKSGRFWKTPRGRSTTIIKGPHVHRGWEKQKRLREDLLRVKEFSRALLEEKKQAKEAARLRAEEKKKQREENQRKAEIVQVIKNTSKIKKMKKKHLRSIQKRDTNDLLGKK